MTLSVVYGEIITALSYITGTVMLMKILYNVYKIFRNRFIKQLKVTIPSCHTSASTVVRTTWNQEHSLSAVFRFMPLTHLPAGMQKIFYPSLFSLPHKHITLILFIPAFILAEEGQCLFCHPLFLIVPVVNLYTMHKIQPYKHKKGGQRSRDSTLYFLFHIQLFYFPNLFVPF